MAIDFEKEKQEQIKELTEDLLRNPIINRPFAEILAAKLYDAGYRKTFTSEFASDTQKAYKDGYTKGIEDMEAEIKRLKSKIDSLGIANRRLFNTNIDLFNQNCEFVKQVKIEVLETVRNNVLAMPSASGAVISQQGLNILIDELIEEVKAE